MAHLWELTIHEAADMLRRREISSVELTRAHLERIAEVEQALHAFITVTPDLALKQAEAADRRFAAGEAVAPLTGIPLAIKDVICTDGVRTTCGSHILENFVPPYDATVMQRLNAAGIVMLGKTNMDEFAMGSSTENSAFFPTRNPWDLARVPGGSSGGSAVAVAACEALGSYGTDTGGSIRQPGALCNVTALKPSYGRVSRFGLVAFASSLDQIGPFARDARDAALLFQPIAGPDPLDSTALNAPVPDYSAALTGDLKGLRVGIPEEYWIEGTEPGVVASVRAAIETLRDLGAEVGEVSLPHTRYGVSAYYIIAPAEASANLARYDGIKYGFSVRAEAEDLLDVYKKTRQQGFGPEVKRRIMLGTYALSSGYYDAYYLRAEKMRTLIKQDFDRAFERFDVLVSPVSPTVAFKLGERVDNPYQMYLSDVFTIPANLAGICGLSMPGPFSEGLPVGVQLLGAAFKEEVLLRVADAYQRATDYHRRRPALAVPGAGARGEAENAEAQPRQAPETRERGAAEREWPNPVRPSGSGEAAPEGAA